MKKRQHEYSKKAALTIVILAAALVGALGFIVWQNVIKSDDVAQTNAPQQHERETTEYPMQEVATAGVLTLSAWGVEIPLDGATAEYRAIRQASHHDGESYYDIKAKVPGCADTAAGTIERKGKIDDTLPAEGMWTEAAAEAGYKTWGEMVDHPRLGSYFAIVGDYVYAYSSPHSVTCDKDNEAEFAAGEMLRTTLFPRLRAAE